VRVSGAISPSDNTGTTSPLHKFFGCAFVGVLHTVYVIPGSTRDNSVSFSLNDVDGIDCL
jgi:hypothetical protein